MNLWSAEINFHSIDLGSVWTGSCNMAAGIESIYSKETTYFFLPRVSTSWGFCERQAPARSDTPFVHCRINIKDPLSCKKYKMLNNKFNFCNLLSTWVYMHSRKHMARTLVPTDTKEKGQREVFSQFTRLALFFLNILFCFRLFPTLHFPNSSQLWKLMSAVRSKGKKSPAV